MAPELSDGAVEKIRTSQASDIFALAMTLFNIWARQLPFHEFQDNLEVAAILGEGDRVDFSSDQY